MRLDRDGGLASRDELETWNDAQIRVAMEKGAFDNLPGVGTPSRISIRNTTHSVVKQLAQREQLSMLPPSLELLRKVAKELAVIETLHDKATVRRRVAALNVAISR